MGVYLLLIGYYFTFCRFAFDSRVKDLRLGMGSCVHNYRTSSRFNEKAAYDASCHNRATLCDLK